VLRKTTPMSAATVTREVLPEKLGMGVRPDSQNPYPIYDQNMRYSLDVFKTRNGEMAKLQNGEMAKC